MNSSECIYFLIYKCQSKDYDISQRTRHLITFIRLFTAAAVYGQVENVQLLGAH